MCAVAVDYVSLVMTPTLSFRIRWCSILHDAGKSWAIRWHMYSAHSLHNIILYLKTHTLSHHKFERRIKKNKIIPIYTFFSLSGFIFCPFLRTFVGGSNFAVLQARARTISHTILYFASILVSLFFHFTSLFKHIFIYSYITLSLRFTFFLLSKSKKKFTKFFFILPLFPARCVAFSFDWFNIMYFALVAVVVGGCCCLKG